MTDEEKIAAIILAIQTDENLIKLIRASVTNSIQVLPTIKLDAAMLVLGLGLGIGL